MTAKTDENKIKLPLFKILVGDFDLLLLANRYAWGLIALFALIETLMFAISGNLTFCMSSSYREGNFCNNNLVVFIILRLALIFIECMFVRNWADSLRQKGKLDLRKIFVPDIRDLKIFGVFIGYVLTLAVAGLSCYLLYIRVPDPDWRIEAVYFALVAWGLLLPVIVIRFGCYLAAAAMGENLPGISEVWHKTSGNFGKILGGFALLIFAGLFVFMQMFRLIWQSGDVVSSLQVLLIEYIIDFIKFCGIALIVNFCYVQYKFLFRSDENE